MPSGSDDTYSALRYDIFIDIVSERKTFLPRIKSELGQKANSHF